MAEGGENKKINLLIFDGDRTHNFVEIFKRYRKKIEVIQTQWVDTTVVSYARECVVTVRPIYTTLEYSGDTVTFKVDFALIRNQGRGPTPRTDKRNVFFGLMHSNVPSVNTFESEYMNMERPIMFGMLKRVKKRCPEFPLIEQNYYCNHADMIISPDFPCIAKVSHAHAGKGKIKIDNYDRWRGVSSILALHNDYCSGEPFVDADEGFRIQKIGPHIRLMVKKLSHSTWTSHDGGSMVLNDVAEDDVPEKYRKWITECSKEFGGMDICSLDGLRTTDGKEVILELNSSASGFLTEYWEEDTGYVSEVVVERMKELGLLQK